MTWEHFHMWSIRDFFFVFCSVNFFCLLFYCGDSSIGETMRNMQVRIEDVQTRAMTLNVPVTNPRAFCIPLAGVYFARPSLLQAKNPPPPPLPGLNMAKWV